jgi:hypothetical protein
LGIDALPAPVGTVDWESYADGLFKDPGMHKKCHQQLILSVLLTFFFVLWVNQHLAWSALGWMTTREHQLLMRFFFAFLGP